MSIDRDTAQHVHAWLQEGETTIPDSLLRDVIERLPVTPQHRRRWPGRWSGSGRDAPHSTDDHGSRSDKNDTGRKPLMFSTTRLVAALAVLALGTTVVFSGSLHLSSDPGAAPLPSRMLAASEGPLEWRWDPLGGLTDEAKGAQEPVQGWGCYGSGGVQVRSAAVGLKGRSIAVNLGVGSAPDIVVTDEAGAVTDVGDPFGGSGWLCGVEASDTHVLAVGSGVFWSDDGVDWNGIEAFEGFAGRHVDGSDLIWAAAGPGGYMVLGRPEDSRRVAWFSEDLESWYEVPFDDEIDGGIGWGIVGPSGVAVGDEPIIVFYDGAWIGTRPED
jgi:hypothetical protein